MKKFLDNMFKPLEIAKERFPITILILFLTFLIVSIYIVFEPIGEFQEYLTKAIVGLAFGVLVNIFFTLVRERCIASPEKPFLPVIDFRKAVLNIVITVIAILVVGAIFNVDNIYIKAAVIGLSLVLFFSTVYILALDDISKMFTHMYKVLHVNTFILGILSAGVGLLVFAFNILVFESGSLETVFYVLMAFVWIVVWISMLLGGIPEEGQVVVTPKLIYILFGLVCLPIFIGLLCILYMYLVRVLFTMSFNKGNVSWFASVASLMFIYLYFILEQYKEEKRHINLFIKYGGLLIIPLILLQFFSMGTRVYYHGLTELRYVSLWLNGLALVVALLSLIKNGWYIKQSFLVVIGVTFILSIGPFNMFDVPLRDQLSRLQGVLRANNMWVEGKDVSNSTISQGTGTLSGVSDGVGKIIPNPNISQKDMITITSTVEYISSTVRRENDVRRKKVPEELLIVKWKDQEFYEIFGFARVNLWSYAINGEVEFREITSDIRYVSWYGESIQRLDLAGFSSLIPNIKGWSEVEGDVLVEDQKVGNIYNFVKGLYEEYGEYIPIETSLYIDFDTCRVVFQELTFNVVREIGSTEIEFRQIRFKAYVLMK